LCYNGADVENFGKRFFRPKTSSVKKGNGTIRKFISKKEMVPLGNSKMKSLMVKNRAKISDDERNKKEKKWS